MRFIFFLALFISIDTAIITIFAWKWKDLSPFGKFGRFMQITGLLAILACFIYVLLSKTGLIK